MNREELFYKAFESKENVCSHIHNAKDNHALEGKAAYPLCVQIYEDGFSLFWYCNECIETYGLPSQGTYIYDAEGSFPEKINTLANFRAGDNPDKNPFSNYLDEQKGFTLPASDFIKLKVTFDATKPIKDSNLLHVPFGAKLI